MGKGMLRNWQRPGAGRGGETGRGEWGQGDGEAGNGEGETGKGRGEGTTGRGRIGKKREDFTDGYDGMPGWT